MFKIAYGLPISYHHSTTGIWEIYVKISIFAGKSNFKYFETFFSSDFVRISRFIEQWNRLDSILVRILVRFLRMLFIRIQPQNYK